jgi:hypothetical protein
MAKREDYPPQVPKPDASFVDEVCILILLHKDLMDARR